VKVTRKAPAKLNLGLEILARRPDGYHEIETVFVPLELHDELELERIGAAKIELEIVGAELPSGPENLCHRAAELALERLALPGGLRIRLDKRIPVAAGLGGGSSDAASVLMGLEQLVGRALPGEERRRIALELGADVPFFLDPRPALGRGVGDRLTPLADIPALTWLLIAFPFGISTPEAYRAASAQLTLPRQGSSIAALLGPSGVVSRPPNDLEHAARRRHPEIGSAQEVLVELGATIAGMSGSGPTVYGHFRSREQAERAAAEALDRLPEGVHALVTRSRAST